MSEKIVVTGVTGQLGKLVVDELKQRAPQATIIGIARNPDKAKDLGIEVRAASYGDAAALKTALTGADKVLLISSSEVGQRFVQHRNVIDAAKANGVKLIAYTSLPHADTNPLALATEHKETEAYIKASGVPFTILRNGWYTENYTASIGAVLQHGAVLGASGDGKIALAARADYAAAAAAVLASDAKSQSGKVYELAGDQAYTMAEYAAEIAKQSGKPIVYKNLSEAEYKAALQSVGLPEAFAGIIADSSAKAAGGTLDGNSKDLSKLIGRPTTPLSVTIAAALKALA